MLSLLKKGWKASLQQRAQAAPDAEEPEPSSSGVKRALDDDEIDLPESKRLKIETVDLKVVEPAENATPSGNPFLLPSFAFPKNLPSEGIKAAISEQCSSILAHVETQNTILLVEDDAAPKDIYIPLLQNAKSGSRHPKPLSFVVMTDSPAQIVVRSRFLSFWAKSCGDRSALSVSVITEVPQDIKGLRQQWEKHGQADVVVASSQVLVGLLHRSVVKLSMLDVVIFLDDVHNVTEGHAIPTILQQYYTPLPSSSRPRILAFLLKVQRPCFYTGAYLITEELLLCSVYGLSAESRAAYIKQIAKPDDMLILYDAEISPSQSFLFKEIHALDQQEIFFRETFSSARRIRTELGAAAADLLWRRFLAKIENNQYMPVASFEMDDCEMSQTTVQTMPDDNLRRVATTIKNWTFALPNIDQSSQGFNVSIKFTKLCQALKCFQVEGDTFRGLVFVKHRDTAIALVEMFQSLVHSEFGYLKPKLFLTTGANEAPENVDGVINADLVNDFRAGTVNLLILTFASEDTVDLPLATCVALWDLPDSYVSYGHCKARADPLHSHFIILCEKGNDRHRRIAYRLKNLPEPWRKWISHVDQDSRSIPPAEMLQTDDFMPREVSTGMELDETEAFLMDIVTGAKMSSAGSIYAVYRYAARALATAQSSQDRPLFTYNELAGPFPHQCAVNFPDEQVVGVILGPACYSKADARRLACYKACHELRRLLLLEAQDYPPPPSIRQASFIPAHSTQADVPPTEVAIRGKEKEFGAGLYPIRRTAFWRRTLTAPPLRLYPTTILISMDPATEGGAATWPGGQAFRAMCIAARLPLPDIPASKVWVAGDEGVAHFTSCAELSVTDSDLSLLYEYTLKYWRWVMMAPLESELERCGFMMIPLLRSWSENHIPGGSLGPPPSIVDYIDWDEVRAKKDERKPGRLGLLDALRDEFADVLVHDNTGPFGNLFEPLAIRTDLSPSSKANGDQSFALHQLNGRRGGIGGLADPSQPLLEALRIPTGLNLFRKSTPLKPESYQFLIPELCSLAPVAASAYRTGLCIPSIIRRVQDMLLLRELNAALFESKLNNELLLEALTPGGAGMSYSYERLELLGDAFLKHVVTIYIVVLEPEAYEDQMHMMRSRMVQNSTLWQVAERCGLPQYILARPFIPSTWLPPGFRRTRKGSKASSATFAPAAIASDDDDDLDGARMTPDLLDEYELLQAEMLLNNSPDLTPQRTGVTTPKSRQRWLGKKAVADVFEAMLGAAFLSGGDELALAACKSIGLSLPNVDRWEDFGRKFVFPSVDGRLVLPDQTVKEVEGLIGHTFSKPELLSQALTHTTATSSHQHTYERFEFVGDAVLDFLVVRLLYDRYPQLTPGGLTMLKMAIVSTKPLAALCVESGLVNYLRYDSPALADKIARYKAVINKAREEELNLCAKEKRPANEYWKAATAPKELADMIESLFAAVLMSDGFKSDGAQAMFDKVVRPFCDRYVRPGGLTTDHPKSALTRMFQTRGCQNFSFEEEGSAKAKNKPGRIPTRCTVICHDVVLWETEPGDTGGWFVAAQTAMDALKGDPGFLDRTCDCRVKAEAERKQHQLEAGKPEKKARLRARKAKAMMDDDTNDIEK